MWEASYKTATIVGKPMSPADDAGTAKPVTFVVHNANDKRPRNRKQIIAEVAEETGESYPMVERLWKEHRRLLADLKRDLDPPPPGAEPDSS